MGLGAWGLGHGAWGMGMISAKFNEVSPIATEKPHRISSDII
jgi:hypothetical protein